MKSLKRLLSLAVSLVMLAGIAALPASAQGEAGVESYRSSYYLDSYRAWLDPQDDGVIEVVVDVQATGYMDDVGALNIAIYESADDGDSWDLVRAYAASMTPGMLQHDKLLYYDRPVSYQGIVGRDYFAVVTVYAGDSTGSDSRDYVTTSVTARK